MSDITIAEAVATTRQFSKFLKGMAKLQETADLLESSETVVAQNKALLLELGAKVSRAQADLEAVNGSLAAARASVGEAEKQSAEILAGAKAEANRIVAQAQVSLTRLQAEGDAARQAAEEAGRARKAALAEEVEVRQRIEAARAAARATFG